MKRYGISLLTVCLILTSFTIGSAQDANFDGLSASDVNADGMINVLDLTLIATQFGETALTDQNRKADVNGDGTINILDLTLVVGHFGKKSGIPFEVTGETFANIVLGSELPIVVEFKSDFCGFCIQMRPIVAEVALEYREVFSVVKLDVNTEREKTIEYGIRGTPTYIVFREGEIAGTFVGAMPKESFVQNILGILDMEEAAPAALVSVHPAEGEISANGTIAVVFDNAPDRVSVSAGTVAVAGKQATITGPFPTGFLALTIRWADGSHTLNYTVTAPDITPPRVIGGTVFDGEIFVDPELLNTDGIEIEFSEAVTGTIALQTEGGDDVGWLGGNVDGMSALLEPAAGTEISGGITYIVAGAVRDGAGNHLEVSITFVTTGTDFTAEKAAIQEVYSAFYKGYNDQDMNAIQDAYDATGSSIFGAVFTGNEPVPAAIGWNSIKATIQGLWGGIGTAGNKWGQDDRLSEFWIRPIDDNRLEASAIGYNCFKGPFPGETHLYLQQDANGEWKIHELDSITEPALGIFGFHEGNSRLLEEGSFFSDEEDRVP